MKSEKNNIMNDGTNLLDDTISVNEYDGVEVEGLTWYEAAEKQIINELEKAYSSSDMRDFIREEDVLQRAKLIYLNCKEIKVPNSNSGFNEVFKRMDSLEEGVKQFGVDVNVIRSRMNELPGEYESINESLNYLINEGSGCKYDTELVKEGNDTLNKIYELLEHNLEKDEEGDDVDEPEPIPEPEPEPRSDTNFHAPYLRKKTGNKITVPLKYKDGKKVKSGTRFEHIKDFFLYDLMDNNKLKPESVEEAEFKSSEEDDLENLLKHDSINMVVIGGSEEITTEDVKKYLLDKEGNKYKIEWLIGNASVDKEDDEKSEEIRAVTSLPVHTKELMNVYSHFKHVLNESRSKDASIIDVFHYIGSLITPFKTKKSNKTTDDFLGAYAMSEEFYESMKSELKPPLSFTNELWKDDGVPKKDELRKRLSDVYRMFYIFNKLEGYTGLDLVDQFNNHRDEEFQIIKSE